MATPPNTSTSEPPPNTAPNAANPNFKCLAQTEEEEQAYDFVKHRNVKFTNMVGSIAHIIKGALGAGVLSGHVAYMKAGVAVGVVFTFLNAIYIFTTLNLLVQSAQILYRRTRIPLMSYPEIAEASFAACHNPKFHRWAKSYRYFVDIIICIDLFGSCACYQIVIAKTLKQLVENTQATTFEGLPGYPNLRVYMAIMIIPLILICLIRYLKYLAPFSFAANLVVGVCVIVTMYYSLKENPNLDGMVLSTNAYGFFEFQGMNIFGMSSVGVVLPIENNMKNPARFPLVLLIGMIFILASNFLISFFGYAGYLSECETPITMNFPMTIGPKIIKGLIAVMIYVTHALNFWVPFEIVFHYIKKRIKKREVFWELFYRGLLVLVISLVSIIFPTVSTLMGFIGSLCLSNMAFIWPGVINTAVIYKRPGLGKFKWRLWRNIFLILVGVIVMCIGSVINAIELVGALRDSMRSGSGKGVEGGGGEGKEGGLRLGGGLGGEVEGVGVAEGRGVGKASERVAEEARGHVAGGVREGVGKAGVKGAGGQVTGGIRKVGEQVVVGEVGKSGGIVGVGVDGRVGGGVRGLVEGVGGAGGTRVGRLVPGIA